MLAGGGEGVSCKNCERLQTRIETLSSLLRKFDRALPRPTVTCPQIGDGEPTNSVVMCSVCGENVWHHAATVVCLRCDEVEEPTDDHES